MSKAYDKYISINELKKTNEKKDEIIKSPIMSDIEKNACIKESNLAYKCFFENDYDKAKCKHYFENYNTCNKFWRRIRFERWLQGKKPALPPPEERASILKERFKEKKLYPWPR